MAGSQAERRRRSAFRPSEPLEARTLFAVSVIDPAFGGGDGAADLGFTAVGSAVQADGKVVVVGTTAYDRDRRLADWAVPAGTRSVVQRFNADGSADASFNGGAPLFFDAFGVTGAGERVEGPSFATAVAVQSDGGIVIAGSVRNDDDDVRVVWADESAPDDLFETDKGSLLPFVTRLLPSGAVDPTFNAGKVAVGDETNVTGISGGSGLREVPTTVIPTGDGRILLGGGSTYGYGDDVNGFFGAFVRSYGSTGTPTAGFGTGGFVRAADLGYTPAIAGIAYSPSDGGIYVVGSEGSGSATVGDNVFAYRFKSDGTRDAAYGRNDGTGKMIARFTASADVSSVARAVALQPDGKLVVAGVIDLDPADASAGQQVAVLRLNANGSKDASFAAAPVALAQASVDGAAIGADGQIGVAGTAAGNAILVAFGPTGAVDTTFGTAGVYTGLAAQRVVLGQKSSPDGTAALTRVTTAAGATPGAGVLSKVRFDQTSPTATFGPVADVTAAGGAFVDVTITYADHVAVAAATVTGANVSLVGPGGSAAASTLVSAVPSNGGKTVVATYRLPAPGGTWDAADNGAYAVALKPSQVFDPAGSAVTAASAAFRVAIAGAGAPTVPTATLSPVSPIVTSGGASFTFTITYSDDAAVNADTVDASDVVVAAPNGAVLPVTAVSKSATGPTVVATYTVAAPGGAWDSADNGVYTISAVGGQVTDAGGAAVAGGTLGTFQVGIVGSTPGNSGDPVTAPAGPLAGQLVATVPAVAVSGQKAKIKAKVVVLNRSADLVTGPVTVQLYLSSDAAAGSDDVLVSTVTKTLKLKAGKAKSLKFKIPPLPAVAADGDYQLLAVVSAPDGSASDWALGPALTVNAPFTDFAATAFVGNPSPVDALPGGKLKAAVRIDSLGNVPASGTINITVRAVNQIDGTTSTEVAAVPVTLKLKPGKGKTVKLKLTLPPALDPGTYALSATLDATILGDTSLGNDAATSGSFTVG